MPLLEPGTSATYGTFHDDDMRRDTEVEEERLLTADGYVSDDASSTVDSVQEGVRKIEAINLTWTTKSLIIAYIR